MRNNQMPSEELINRVREVAAFDCKNSEQLTNDGRGTLLSYLGGLLHSALNELKLDVSRKESKEAFGGKYKLTYTVAHEGEIQLEFTDSTYYEKRSPVNVRVYHPGEWEQKIYAAHQKCLELRDKHNLVSDLENQLGYVSHTPEEVIKLVEATGDTEQTIMLLALRSDWKSSFGALSLSYCALGKGKEAKFVAETFLSVRPWNADLHLAFGNLFLGALINSNPPPKDSISFLRQTAVTIGKAGEELLDSLKQKDPSLYRALTDTEYELRIPVNSATCPAKSATL